MRRSPGQRSGQRPRPQLTRRRRAAWRKRAERAACLAVWSEQMSEDEKDVFRWPRSCCPRAQRPNREAGARA